MDLKLKDVAELLNVSEITVRRWIADGKIPYYRLNHQFRFSRGEIENWMLSCKQGGEFLDLMEGPAEPQLGTQQFGLYRAIHKGGVYADVPGTTKEEVIHAAVERISADICLDADVISELLLDREKLMPTALSNGVAVPHTRDFLLQESFDVVAVVFPRQPIEYGALDSKPVDILFFLFACDDKRHLHLLAKLAHLSSREDNLAYLRTNPSKEQLLEYIKHWETSLRESVAKV
jgi:PTS system nitrogen regulatory IIA component